MKTAKRLLIHSPDPYMALLSYWAGLSPAELLMEVKALLVPNWLHVGEFRTRDKRHKARQKRAYDQRYRVKALPLLTDKLPVWVEHQSQVKLYNRLTLTDHIW